MIVGGKRLDVDLSKCDYEVWLAVMTAIERRFGPRAFITDDPHNRQPMQKIADWIGEITRLYASLPIPPSGH